MDVEAAEAQRQHVELQKPQAVSSPDSPAEEKLPEPYYTFNPGLLDHEKWSFRDLQLLSMKLGLGGAGKREQIVERLRSWHKQKFDTVSLRTAYKMLNLVACVGIECSGVQLLAA